MYVSLFLKQSFDNMVEKSIGVATTYALRKRPLQNTWWKMASPWTSFYYAKCVTT